ncbi:MAG: 16S rRNA (guanine(966)-N(2))-methyltransferase RsmD [bacterium]
MPRVIGGIKKKAEIPGPSLKTRPILARVKKSLFSSIEPKLKGAYFLDLYAGTGACGIEALSKGASYCVFVERDREQAKKIREVLKRLKMDNARVITANVFSLKLKDSFDIIFLGPPYRDFLVNKTLYLIDKKAMLKDDGMLIAQHHKKEKIEEKIGSFVLERQKPFGETMLSFYIKSGVWDNSF